MSGNDHCGFSSPLSPYRRRLRTTCRSKKDLVSPRHIRICPRARAYQRHFHLKPIAKRGRPHAILSITARSHDRHCQQFIPSTLFWRRPSPNPVSKLINLGSRDRHCYKSHNSRLEDGLSQNDLARVKRASSSASLSPLPHEATASPEDNQP